MRNVAQSQLVFELARDVVACTAPQELPLFRPVSEAYFKDPEKTLTSQRGKDEALGFGIGDAMAFMTPVVLAVITDVVKYVGEQVLPTVKEESATVASDAVKRVFKKFRPVQEQAKAKPEGLTREQIGEVRRLALEKACQLKLPMDQANLLADSVAGCLVQAS